MKNVAKCDTWCELQNPVNHRVFERKLRPKPLGRGLVCLGVTYRRPNPNRPMWRRAGRKLASRALPARGWPKHESQASRAPRRSVVYAHARRESRAPDAPRDASRPCCVPPRTLASRPQVRRDYPLSLSISISGGKETYKDSPSNGERTGKSPA